MTAATGAGRDLPFWLWDGITALGVIATVPNLLVGAFIGGWTSVPAHRAAPDGEPLPALGPLDVALNYWAFWLVLVLAACSITARLRRQRRAAAVIALVQLAFLGIVAVPLILII